MKMFGFSKKRMKIGRLKVQLSDSAQGTPMRQPKRLGGSNGGNGGVAPASNDSEESSGAPELNSGGSENWMVLSITGDKPIPRFNHAAAVVGNKMVIVGGESATEMLEDVQVLNFDQFSWTNASSKLHLSPTSLPLKIPACKGHALIAWGKKVLLIGGKTDPSSDKLSVWAFDTETECWSLMEAKGDIPVARSGHTVVRASSTLILFGGEDSKRRKLKDLHMFDLKSLTWLPLSLNCTGSGPSPRSNHVSALYDDKLLLVFGGSSKSRTLNDLYSLDFDTMIWSSIKVRGFHPSPRAGCCGVLCGSKWYIAGGGTRTKRHVETLVFDVLKHEWSVSSPSSSVTTNKGFSLVLVQHKERDFLVAFGGLKKDPSNQVEVLMVERNDLSFNRSSIISKNAETSIGVASQTRNGIDAIARQNLASAIEHHGSGRRSLSETLHADPNSISLRKQFYNDEKNPEEESQATMSGSSKLVTEEHSGTLKTHHRQGSESFPLEIDDDGKSGYEAKVNSLIRKNGILEGQLAVALANKETAEKNACCAIKSKQDMEKQLCDALKEMEMLKEKVSGLEMAQDEANSLSNIVHSDNVRLEHDVAFLKAVLDDTQKELHSTRGVLAGERARAFQLQVEVFHVKQRLQSLENRTQTPRKPFHM